MTKVSLLPWMLSLAVTTAVQAQSVPKEQWLGAMKTSLPTAFCHADEYFRRCFNVTAVECEETAASAVRVCLNEFSTQIPEYLHQPQSGSLWGIRVGECAGAAYETTLAARKIQDKNCAANASGSKNNAHDPG